MFSQIFHHKSGHTKYSTALHRNESVLFSSITVCLCCCYVYVCHDFSCLTTEFRIALVSLYSMLEKQGVKDSSTCMLPYSKPISYVFTSGVWQHHILEISSVTAKDDSVFFPYY